MGKQDSERRSGVALVVDVGNSVTNVGLVSDDALFTTWTLTTTELMTADEVRARIASFFNLLAHDAAYKNAPTLDEVGDGVVASVVPGLTDAWVEALNRIVGHRPLVVGPGLKTGLKMRYNDPGELGADRIADLVAARAEYKMPLVMVDLGTTTNFEVLDRDGVFVGGIIAPGLKLSARALSDAAARLATVDIKAPTNVIGKNTREAMQSGIVVGECARIDGLIELVWQELGYETDVVVTGFDAAALAALSRHTPQVDEHLTLRGLSLLLKLNRH